MKVTRFVNGSKLTKPIDDGMVIENQVILNTIEHVNQRLRSSVDAKTERINYE
ncbi:MAG: hypothetical protein IJV86_04745 [Clostridia bacterium]|nr:hypothetical protein [Clostridia bacterium]